MPVYVVFFIFLGFYLLLVLLSKAIVVLFGGREGFSLVFRTFIAPSSEEWVPVLEKEFHYYNKLPDKSKKEFLKRLKMFYYDKNFVAKGGIKITERMKVLICASAAQLTFGLDRLRLPHFHDILIYPSKYLNKRSGKMHMGEMNSQGVVAFSWEHIEKSLDDPSDGYNLLLHELCHALRFEDYYPNEERHFLEQDDVNRLHHLFRKLQGPIKDRSAPFLNKYAGANFEEFIAVAVESFFERPVEFDQKMPDLYNGIRLLLNQDPKILERLNKKG